LSYASRMETCTGPECEREAVAEGLCPTHYKQRQRGRPLTPIRERGNPLVHFATRLPQETIDALGPEPATKAREVLNAWARRQRR
jgi:hypothetical protein